jgi:hypothetical protein
VPVERRVGILVLSLAVTLDSINVFDPHDNIDVGNCIELIGTNQLWMIF